MTAKPKVLHIITRMIRGGAQKNTLATLRGLRSKGYQVTLITGPSSGPEGDILEETLAEGFEVIVIPELVREIHPLKDAIALYKLWKHLEQVSYDLVHTHTSKAGILGRLAAWLRKVPLIVHTPHGHIFHSYFSVWKEKTFLYIERYCAKITRHLIALTDCCRKEHLELKVGSEDQWSVIPSGVAQDSIREYPEARADLLTEYKIPAGRKMIGFIGRLAPVKGANYLIRALLPLYWAKLDFHCVLVGDGEERPALEGLVLSSNLTGRVTFAGQQTDISKFLSAFDVLVVPSLNEGMGRVIVEAGFLRKPVVASLVGGIPDLIENGKTGFLAAPRDPEALAAAMIQLLKEPSLGEAFGEALYEKVSQDYTEEKMVEKICDLYERLLKKHLPVNAESAQTAPADENPLKPEETTIPS